MTASPFDDIRALIGQSVAQAPFAGAPIGAGSTPVAGADWIGAWRGEARVSRPILALYAGAHAGGDAADTRAFLEAVAAGEAAVARGARHLGAGLDVYDLALDRPLPSAEAGPTMSERECAATMAFGMEVLAKQPDMLMLVGLGPGSDASARAVLAALALDEEPLALLRRLGGREAAAVVGAIVGARCQNIPVLIDGLPALAAAAVLAAVDPAAVAHCRLAGLAEGGAFAIPPLTAVDVTGSDGAAALVALSMVQLACAMAQTA